MNMDELRGRIDAVDEKLLRCFAERMDIAGDIARYKAEHGLPVLDERREREKLYAVSEKAPEELQSYAVSLYALLFELSSSRQNRLLHKKSPLAESVQSAIENTPPLFPEKAAVACQGVEGSNSQIACERLYGLSCLAPSVQDTANNYTRFICIARDLEIYPGANRTSLMMTLRHEPGSLYKVLSRFYALGINLNKLESRPLPERNFEFMFYFDLENPVYDPAFLQLMRELGDISEECTYLGSYSEVI